MVREDCKDLLQMPRIDFHFANDKKQQIPNTIQTKTKYQALYYHLDKTQIAPGIIHCFKYKQKLVIIIMNVCVDACRKQLGDADHVAGYPINMHWEEKAQTGC